jgi:hypothetical protein
MQLMMAQAERVQTACEALIRLGGPGLGDAAQGVAAAALRATVHVGEDEFPEEVETAVATFTAEARKVKA